MTQTMTAEEYRKFARTGVFSVQWTVSLELPFPPSVNTYWRKWKNRMVLSPRGRRYKKDVAALMLVQFPGQGVDAQIAQKINAELDFYPPDKRKRDQDNFEKGLWDALVFAGVILDDSLVRNVVKRWHEPVKGGNVKVRLYPV